MPPAVIDIQLTSAPVQYVPVEHIANDSGGECVFLGRTRAESHTRHGSLTRLSYEAYQPMALEVLHQLAEHARQRFGCQFVRIHHALGEVAPGEASVLVQTVCERRAAAFESCRFLIDQLKSHAPIWKREEWADGSTWSTGIPVKVESSL